MRGRKGVDARERQGVNRRKEGHEMRGEMKRRKGEEENTISTDKRRNKSMDTRKSTYVL